MELKMIGYIVIVYWVLALFFTYNIGMNIQGGAFIIGAICAYWAGSGASGMMTHGRLFLGLALGSAVAGIGFFANHYAEVVIFIYGEPYSADMLVIWTAIVFFFITPDEVARD